MKQATFRRYRPEDAAPIAALFNARYGGFVGPIEITAESWDRMYTDGWWNCPSLESDPDCVQVAERDGLIVGYGAFACDPGRRGGDGVIQEIVTGPGEADLAEDLLAHCESICAGRGAAKIVMPCSDSDRELWGLLDRCGYDGVERDFSVFMLAVVDLGGLLERLAPTLKDRVEASGIEMPGRLTLTSPSHSASVELGDESRGGCAFEMTEDALVGLVTGTVAAEEAYLDGSLKATDAGPLGGRAIEFLGALLPRMPHAMIRAHSW